MNSISIQGRITAGTLIFLLQAWPVEAHLAVADSALFSGLLQPGVHVEGLLLLAALGAWSGVSMREYRGDVRILLGFYCAGFVAGGLFPDLAESTVAAGSLGGTIALSLLVALDRPGGMMMVRILFALGGVIVAMYGREGLAIGLPQSLFFAAGAILSSLTLISVILAMARNARGRLLGIGIRMGASWMVAISAMILAFRLKGGH